MDFADPPEHADLRQTVGAVTDKYGPDYFAERAVAREPTDELWKDLADHGFIGINFPEEYGGGGAGMTELAIVCEETAAHGCPLLLLLVSSAISGELLAKYGSDLATAATGSAEKVSHPLSNQQRPRRAQRHVNTDALAAQGRCHFGQPSLPIAVTNHIDGFGGSHNNGITWLRGESGIRFESQLIT